MPNGNFRYYASAHFWADSMGRSPDEGTVQAFLVETTAPIETSEHIEVLRQAIPNQRSWGSQHLVTLLGFSPLGAGVVGREFAVAAVERVTAKD